MRFSQIKDTQHHRSLQELTLQCGAGPQVLPSATQDHLHGEGLAHFSNQALRAAHARDDSQRHLWLHRTHLSPLQCCR